MEHRPDCRKAGGGVAKQWSGSGSAERPTRASGERPYAHACALALAVVSIVLMRYSESAF